MQDAILELRSPANGHKLPSFLAIGYRNGHRLFAKTPQEMALCDDTRIATMTAAELLEELQSNRVAGNQAKLARLLIRTARLL